MPFVAAPLYGWSAVLVTALISYSLMGVDEIASVVEEPFQVRPAVIPVCRQRVR